jgi:hypothetical protein
VNVISKLPTEYRTIAGPAVFSLDWFAPPVADLVDIIEEGDYSDSQQLILELSLRIYSILRSELEKNPKNTDQTRPQWDQLRRFANSILEYAALAQLPDYEAKKLKIYWAGIDFSEILSQPADQSQPTAPEGRAVVPSSADRAPVKIQQKSVLGLKNSEIIKKFGEAISGIQQQISERTTISAHVSNLATVINAAIQLRLGQLGQTENKKLGKFEFIKSPRLFFAFHYRLASFADKPIPGRYIKSVLYFPLEEREFRIEKLQREETKSEHAQSVVDSNSTEATQSLVSELKNTKSDKRTTESESEQYFRENNHLDTSVHAYVDYGKNNFSLDKLVTNVNAGGSFDFNWSNDQERSQNFRNSVGTESAVESISSAVQNQASKTNTARQITVTEKIEKTITTEEKNLEIIRRKNYSELSALVTSLYQSVIPYKTYLLISKIEIFASNGLRQISVPINQIAQLKTALPEIYPYLENELKSLKFKLYNNAEITPFETGFSNPDPKTRDIIPFGLAIHADAVYLNSDSVVEIVERVQTELLDEIGKQYLLLKNKKIEAEIDRIVAVNEGIRNCNSVQLDPNSVAKIYAAVTGRDLQSATQLFSWFDATAAIQNQKLDL